MNKKITDKTSIELSVLSDVIASWLVSSEIKRVFADNVKLTTDNNRKILNICFNFSFQSEGLDDDVQLAIQDVIVNDFRISKWRNNEWEKDK